MKKIIQTCFLALLCLVGSATIAQVADSPPPGVDTLHRFGDPHRGGETRPDTFPPGSSLVDMSDPAGQRSESSSADGGEVLILKGLIKSSPAEKHRLSYRLSTQEIDPYYGRFQLSEGSIALAPGSFYTGTSGGQVFELQIPLSGFGRLSVYDGDSPWLEDIWVRAGDSLLLHREGTRLFFSGPSAEAVRVQIQLQDIFEASNAERNPVMILSDAGAMLNTPAKMQAYQDAVDSYVPGWSRHMVWLESEADKLTRAKELFAAAGNGHPVLTALERSQEMLDAEHYHWLYGYWKGRLAIQALQFAAIAKPASADWASLILENSLEEPFSRPQQGKAPAELVEALYLESKLLSALTPVSFLHLSESLPDPLEEQVNALYLVREYKELSDADSLFRQVIAKTQSPEILLALEQLYRSSLKGRDFAPFAFEDESGREVFPKEWKGKLVLMDFWLSGCGACLKFAGESFLPVLEEFRNHPGLVIVTVAGDSSRELWKQSLASNRYTNGQALNLFSGGASHPTLRENLIQSFPAQLILDREGKILQTGGFPTDRQGWIDLIKSYLGESRPAGAPTNTSAFSQSSPIPY
jgi:thiol-disulfide isomerase/thioredoxin